MKVSFLLLFICSFFVFPVFSQENGNIPVTSSAPGTDFSQGEELFLHNKPEEALPFLEKAFIANQEHLEGALYLAMCYEQLGRLDEAVTIYRIILPNAGDKTATVACNLGNVYFKRDNFSLAQQFYTQAIRADPAYASAWLNRANVFVRNGSLQEAISDYERYLRLEPGSSQRIQIERLISLIQEEFAAGEIRRLMAAEAAREESERRQRLIDEVSASLQAQADEAEGIAAGAEALSGYDGEFELE